ncbi:MAG: VWA domain-containing protein [Phycisphaerales bacterium]|nr:MAG: VWA domain-containing protein [Phycisphaerales bacterium]
MIEHELVRAASEPRASARAEPPFAKHAPTAETHGHGAAPLPPPLRLRHIIPAALAACLLLAVGVAFERFYDPTPSPLVTYGPGIIEPEVEGVRFADASGQVDRGLYPVSQRAAEFQRVNGSVLDEAFASPDIAGSAGVAIEPVANELALIADRLTAEPGDGDSAGDVNLDEIEDILGEAPNARQVGNYRIAGRNVMNPRDAIGEGGERYWMWSQSGADRDVDATSLGVPMHRTNNDPNLEGRPPQQRTYPFQFNHAQADGPVDREDGYFGGGLPVVQLPGGDWTYTVADSPQTGDSANGLSDRDLLFANGEVAEPFRTMEYAKGDAAAGLQSLGYVDSAGEPLAGTLGYRFDESTRPSYAPAAHNPFKRVSDEPLSTFSIDVDTASYANVRRHLNDGLLPPPDAVRVEEMVNYFNYDYPIPGQQHPFSVTVDVAETPWMPEHRLVRIGLKGYEMTYDQRPASNLVFLLDVSGSMNQPNKLPLVKESLRMFAEQLDQYDRVAMVVYAGASGLVLDSTTADNQQVIIDALDRLEAGGSTNGGAGIELAYSIATKNFIEDGTNRVILATDGDFNVGTTSRGDLQRLIEEKAKSGVFLSVLGFGYDNLQDDTLETLADKGNGNYAYIDTLGEARKVLVDQMDATINTIAKDVKIQVEFNPAAVAAYRLIGYENRVLAARDFNDDAKDAGEIGAGHTVTALYEIVPAEQESELAAAGVPAVDPLKYQAAKGLAPAADSGELLTVKLRYKQPDGDVSELVEQPVVDAGLTLEDAPADFAFAAAVASFGMLLRGSPYAADWTYDAVYELGRAGIGEDPYGYRAEFLELVGNAREIALRGSANGE